MVDGAPLGEEHDVARLIAAAARGDRGALDELLPVVYEELKAAARRQMRRERADHTLRATALVHEAYVKLAGSDLPARDRAGILALAGRAMRQVLVDHARARRREKRGGGWVRTTLGPAHASVDADPAEILALDDALETLEPRQRQVVESRYFAGLDEAETARALGVSVRTVRREWVKARARLYAVLYAEGGPGPRASGSPPGGPEPGPADAPEGGTVAEGGDAPRAGRPDDSRRGRSA